MKPLVALNYFFEVKMHYNFAYFFVLGHFFKHCKKLIDFSNEKVHNLHPKSKINK